MPGLGTGPGTAFRQDILAARPPAEPSLMGYFFFATDDNGGTLYQCTWDLDEDHPAEWVQITGGLVSLAAGSGISIVSSPGLTTISNTYSLPIASGSQLGGIKVGPNLSIDVNGVLSGAAPYTLPIASPSILGGIKVGANLSIDGGGVLSGAAPYTLPIASVSVLGGIKVGSRLEIDGGGVLSTTALVDIITFVINGGGATIATGIVGDLVVPFACTINQVTLLADQTTNAVVNIWKQTYSSFPPTVTQKITASAPPTITAAIKSQDSTLTGWITSIASGDILRFNVDSCSAATLITISLKVTRS